MIDEMSDSNSSPGSRGERELQRTYASTERANSFYDNQMLDHLNDRMRQFVSTMEMMFVSTADARGECDCSIRCGEAGFVQAIDGRSLIYPEFRGNGVMASLGNLRENQHIGLLFVDFFRDCIGLHVNGKTRVVENDNLPNSISAAYINRFERRAERWVIVDVHEAYIHCSKHIPMLAKLPKKISWGTDDPAAKGGDYFHIRSSLDSKRD